MNTPQTKRPKPHRQIPLLSIMLLSSMLCAILVEPVKDMTENQPDSKTGTAPDTTDLSSCFRTVSQAVFHVLCAPPDTDGSACISIPADLNPDTESLHAVLEDSLADAATQEPLSFVDVTRDYFDDALFIGDSRVVGVELYSGWDNLTYYAESGMTVYNLFDCLVSDGNGGKIPMEEALGQKSFGKIYLEIGINEMGTGTVDSFLESYGAVVRRLRKLQPDAILFLCGIMCVEQEKSETDPIFNNPSIRERNEGIAALADGQNIFYLDINESVTDETGNLNPDYTWDAVHLLGKYDILWMDYFCSHGIVKGGEFYGRR